MSIVAQEQVALLTDYDTDSAYSLAYQKLYANIRFSWESEQHRQHTLLFTAPTAHPGYAAAAANVAIAAAQNGTPTLLVDADLSAPTLQQRFGLGESSGLSNLLKEDTITPQMLSAHLSKTFIPSLRLLSAGTARLQPHEVSHLFFARLPDLLAGMRQVLAEAECKSSVVIFHSPPVLAGIDAAQISSLVEQTFLVIISGRTTRVQARQAQEQLQRAHAKLTGIIMLDN